MVSVRSLAEKRTTPTTMNEAKRKVTPPRTTRKRERRDCAEKVKLNQSLKKKLRRISVKARSQDSGSRDGPRDVTGPSLNAIKEKE